MAGSWFSGRVAARLLGNLTDPHPSSSGRKAAGLPICTSLE
jgi:hypothetical protein